MSLKPTVAQAKATFDSFETPLSAVKRPESVIQILSEALADFVRTSLRCTCPPRTQLFLCQAPWLQHHDAFMANEEARSLVFKIREKSVTPVCAGIKVSDLPDTVRDFQTLCKRTMDAFEAKKVPNFFLSSVLLSSSRTRSYSPFLRRLLRNLIVSLLIRTTLTRPYVSSLSKLPPSYDRSIRL